MFLLNCLKFAHKLHNLKLPAYFDNWINTGPSHKYHTRNANAITPLVPAHASLKLNLRFFIPKLLNSYPPNIEDKIKTHKLRGLYLYAKNITLNSYINTCTISNCYTCNNNS